MRAFCTIITSDYAHYALALYQSFYRFCKVPLEVLCVDRNLNIEQKYAIPQDMRITWLHTTTFDKNGQKIVEKYRNNPDALRWSLKSVWVSYLLTQKKYSQVLYVDPDIYFCHDPGFLFSALDTAAVLLTPHWRSTDPVVDPFNFELNFRDGVYNGGFLGASARGLMALGWLASACLYRCEIDFQSGLFFDQKYLDLLQSRFEGVHVEQHKGCNVASWNQVDCRRAVVNGKLLINGIDPVVFVHMTKSTITAILTGQDRLLKPLLDEYEAALKDINPSYVPFRGPEIPKQTRRTNFLRRWINRFSGG